MPFLYQRQSLKTGEGVEILGYRGNIRRLVVPESLDGLPVTSIGARAFYGREDIREVWLPDSLRELKGFAFYGCANLKKLHLSDGVEDYYDGVIRQCGALSEIGVEMKRGSYRLIRELLGDNDRQFLICLKENGEEFCLLFPSWLNDFTEDTMARAIHLKIEGAGYPFRECVSRSGINYREYDRVFFRASSEDDRCAVLIALLRLRYPHALDPDAEKKYRTYLTGQMAYALRFLIDEDRTEDVRFLMEEGLIRPEDFHEALARASGKKKTELTGILMEGMRKAGSAGAKAEVFCL